MSLRATYRAAAISLVLILAAIERPSATMAGGSDDNDGPQQFRRVLVISIDGMHAVDFANCSSGIGGINSGSPYCPAMADLARHGINYLSASSSKPSDSYPGIVALMTGGSPKTTGVYYDVSYDRRLSPPKAPMTPNGIPGGAGLCPGTRGTQVGLEEEIDIDLTKLNGGGGINPDFLPRDPDAGCQPVYPHQFIRVNTVFEIVRAAGGHTAWVDKHLAYEILNGPSGAGVVDFYAPEINSIPTPLPTVPGCFPALPDPVTSSDDWTTSFTNIQCYDSLKVQAVINQMHGRTHDGAAAAPVPALFGMNFQAVSVGQKLNEHQHDPGGYLDSEGTPGAHLLDEIRFVDRAIGQMVQALKQRGLFESTLIIISAKHGQSPIDPHRLLRIDADAPADVSPSGLLSPAGVGPGLPVVQAIEDDVSLMWLGDQRQTEAQVDMLEQNTQTIGGGEIFSGAALRLMFGDPRIDSRTPDIIVAPNVGVVYTGKKKKLAEHGGFAHDDTNVMLLVSNPDLPRASVASPVETMQVAPTILSALGLDPGLLDAVRIERTAALPGIRPQR
jgi:hypothetical protein